MEKLDKPQNRVGSWLNQKAQGSVRRKWFLSGNASGLTLYG